MPAPSRLHGWAFEVPLDGHVPTSVLARHDVLHGGGGHRGSVGLVPAEVRRTRDRGRSRGYLKVVFSACQACHQLTSNAQPLNPTTMSELTSGSPNAKRAKHTPSESHASNAVVSQVYRVRLTLPWARSSVSAFSTCTKTRFSPRWTTRSPKRSTGNPGRTCPISGIPSRPTC